MGDTDTKLKYRKIVDYKIGCFRLIFRSSI